MTGTVGRTFPARAQMQLRNIVCPCMPNGHILQLEDLPAMHPPCGVGLRHAFAAQAVYRLCIDPTPQPLGTMDRTVEIDWIKRPGNAPAVQIQRRVGWTNLQNHLANLNTILVHLPFTLNAHDLTAHAALAVMALVIRDLEGAVLQTVLQIGSGGDYLVQIQGGARPTQVEGSGILNAAISGVAQARLHQKRVQVLTRSPNGFVSITTFAHPGGQQPGPIVHSYMHYVVQGPSKKAGGKRGEKRKRNKGKKK